MKCLPALYFHCRTHCTHDTATGSRSCSSNSPIISRLTGIRVAFVKASSKENNEFSDDVIIALGQIDWPRTCWSRQSRVTAFVGSSFTHNRNSIQPRSQVTRNPEYYQNFARSLHDCDVIFSEKSSLEWKKNMTSRFRYKFTQYITKTCYDFNQKNTWIHLKFYRIKYVNLLWIQHAYYMIMPYTLAANAEIKMHAFWKTL